MSCGGAVVREESESAVISPWAFDTIRKRSVLTDGVHDEAHAVQILDLATRTKCLADLVDRHVDVAAERPLSCATARTRARVPVSAGLEVHKKERVRSARHAPRPYCHQKLQRVGGLLAICARTRPPVPVSCPNAASDGSSD